MSTALTGTPSTCFTGTFPATGPFDGWCQHIDGVEARTVPLPTGLVALLDQLDSQLTNLAEDAPLAALKGVAVLECMVKRVAGSAAMNAEADAHTGEELGRALGAPRSDAESRLLRYLLTRTHAVVHRMPCDASEGHGPRRRQAQWVGGCG